MTEKIDLNHCTHSIILGLLDIISREEFKSLYDQQNSFWKERLENICDEDFFHKSMDLDESKLSSHDNDLHMDSVIRKMDIISVDLNDDEVPFSYFYLFYTVFDFVKLKYYKFLSRKIDDNDSLANIKRLKKLLVFMAVLSRKNGLAELDFEFLREDGIQEMLFQWMLIGVTSALFHVDDYRKDFCEEDESLTLYETVLFVGLSAIQDGENPEIVSKRIDEIYENIII